ncbi:oligosaccharide flippase family protein [Amnibacterium endophyticum]|uniref:Oligosaccharide flippase family protein n=1 Tax=Amnibacterium endophyticum TaxID=2109337 RepID=A0ABW4LCA6_9MICO
MRATEVTDQTSASAFRGRAAATAVRWSSLSVLGRQGFQILLALVLARIIGPEAYGAVAAATVVVTLAALLLDQGLAAALVQRPDLPTGSAGATATINLASAAVLGLLAVVTAPLLSAFLGAPGLAALLLWLGPGLLLKGAAIVPRAMLLRRLALKPVAVVEIAGAALGTAVGLAAALSGAGAFAMVLSVLVADGVVAVALLVLEGGPVPNLRLAAFAPLAGFGGRVFATNGVAYLSRNTDTVLVGHLLGAAALAQYAMAYRVLVIPVQFLGQSVNRVLFPVLSRAQGRRDELAEQLSRATRLLALTAVPPMVLVACAAPQLVEVLLGAAWAPTAPVMAVLALAGARETVFYVTPVLMRATGRAGLGLRFQVLSTVVQVAGIVAGLPFGLLGVAVGYAVGGFLLVPVLLVVQHRLAGVTARQQLGAILPPVHAAAWGALGYLLVALLPMPAIATALAGGVVFALLAVGVLRLAHPAAARDGLARVRALAGRG